MPSIEEAKSRIDHEMDDKKRQSTVPSMLGDDEKKRWSDYKSRDPEKSIPMDDIEIPQNDPPPAVFASYPPPRSRRWGLFIPAWLIVLFILVFLFESSVLFIYTIVGLYKETAPVVLSAASAAGLPGACNCPSFGTEAGINAAPNMVQPSVSIITVTDTPLATHASPIRETSVSTSVSTASSVSTSVSTDSTVSTTTASASTSLVTTTASPPSTTVTTVTPTQSPVLSTIFSTSTVPNTPSPQHTIFSTETVGPSSSGKPSSDSKSARKAAVTTTGTSSSASASASLQARCTWPFCCNGGGSSAELHPGDPC